MSDQEQWTGGTHLSDDKLGTDDPEEEADNVAAGAPVRDEHHTAAADEDRNP